MPANPLHFLVILPLHLKSPSRFDALTLLIASTFVDLEMVFGFILGYPISHGIIHSYLIVLTIYPLFLSIIFYYLFKRTNGEMKKTYDKLRLNPKSIDLSFKHIFVNCVVGGVSHLFLDMWTHESSPFLFYPLTTVNPFWLSQTSILVTLATLLLSGYSIQLWWRNGFKTRTNYE
ncbi:DUF4184 family protein [Candidatus Bathyarchaeota archaeon]|nr:DUF4184 family protein [Candidatus Bathyarchaeota archaeon]